MASCAEICGSEQSERHAQKPKESGCHRYGVRSYLHHFYEECTASVWERHEDFQAQRSPRWWSSGLWKVTGSLPVLHSYIVLTNTHILELYLATSHIWYLSHILTNISTGVSVHSVLYQWPMGLFAVLHTA